MAFQYPVKPWVDGQEIKINFHGEEVVIAKYDASKNLWTHLRVNDDGVFKYVTSCEVLLNRSCSDPCLPNIEWESIDNLQTALDYLYYWLFDETNGAIPRIDELAKDIENNADAIKELQDLIATIEGIGDFSQLLDRLNSIEDKVNNLTSADIKQAPLQGQGGFEIPEGVRKGTQQETNYYLADLLATLSAANNADHEIFREELANLESDVIDNNNNTNDSLDTKVDKAGDTMTGALDFQLGSKTSPQFTIAPNIAGAATNIFTTGGQLRLRTSHTEDINDRQGSHIILDPNNGDPVTSIFNVRDPANQRDATPRIYVDGQDEALQGQIDDGIETQQEIIADVETLQNKVTALEGSVVDASWTFESDDRTPRAGEFALRGNGDAVISDWSSAQSIIISTTSADGDIYTFDKVTVNDVIRIGAADGSSAEYKVLTIVSPGVYLIEHLRSSGVATDETEYAFTFLSAFDPEGLATIDYVDAQDDTRVKKAGDTVQGPLVFDTNNTILEVAGDSGSMQRRYVKVRGNNQFEIIAYPAQDNSNSKIAFRLVSNTNGSPELTLNYLVDPTSNGHAVNKRWGDANYYPFTGGSITGNVIIENASFYVKDGSGTEKFRVQPNGFCRTRDLFRAERDDGGPALQARIGSSLNAEIRCDGKATFKNDVTISNDGELVVNKSSSTAIQIKQSGTAKAKIWSDGTFETERTSFSDKNLVTKKYVEDRLSETVGTPAVEVSTSSLPPAAKPRGHLLLTTSNNFYIYL